MVDYQFVTAAPLFYIFVCSVCSILLLFLKKILSFLDSKGVKQLYSHEPFSTRKWEGVHIDKSKLAAECEADEETHIDTPKGKADLGPMGDGPTGDGEPIRIEMNALSQKSDKRLPVKIELNPTLDSPMFDQLEASRRSVRDSQVGQRNEDYFGSLGNTLSVALINC